MLNRLIYWIFPNSWGTSEAPSEILFQLSGLGPRICHWNKFLRWFFKTSDAWGIIFCKILPLSSLDSVLKTPGLGDLQALFPLWHPMTRYKVGCNISTEGRKEKVIKSEVKNRQPEEFCSVNTVFFNQMGAYPRSFHRYHGAQSDVYAAGVPPYGRYRRPRTVGVCP